MSVFDYSIEGNDLQMIEINLTPGQGVKSEAGSMVFMERGIEMSTTSGGGVFSGFKRMIGGAGFFLTEFTNSGGSGSVAVGFAAPYPGKVIPIELTEHGGQLLAQKDAFLCASVNTEIDIAFTKRFSAGFFGGDGFILQKLSGQETVFIHAGGTLIKKELAAGEELMVDTGCLAAFEGSVSYEIELVKGVSNMLFGGEGLFFAKLRGPGKVYVQSMPFAKLAHKVAQMIPKK